VSENGEHVLFKGATDSDRKDISTAFYAIGNTASQAMDVLRLNKPGITYFDSRVIYSKDGKSVVIVDFLQRGDNPNEGYVFTRGKDGKPIVLWVENFDKTLPNVTR
jgi:hypothetical protein